MFYPYTYTNIIFYFLHLKILNFSSHAITFSFVLLPADKTNNIVNSGWHDANVFLMHNMMLMLHCKNTH